MADNNMWNRALNLLVHKYECKKCGYLFEYSPLIPIVKPFILTDPAPSPISLFKRPGCPKCGSKKLKKLHK